MTLAITPRDLSVWRGRWVARQGRYRLFVGDSSTSAPVRLHVTLARKIVSGRALAPAPRIHPDSSRLATECYKDRFAPDVAALLTAEGDAQAVQKDLGSLP